VSQSRSIRVLTTDEERELLEAAQGAEVHVVEAALYSGIRLRRLEGLGWSDMRLSEGRLQISEVEQAPVTPTFARVLCELTADRANRPDGAAGGDLGLANARNTLRRVARRAGVPMGERVLEATFAARARRHSAKHWMMLARQAVTSLHSLDLRQEPAAVSAFAAGATAFTSSWRNHVARRLLKDLERKRNPDGGFGLNKAYDAFQTGEENPPDTSYTITIAGHVGRVLIGAASEGAVTPNEIDRLVELLLKTPRCPGGPGTCFGYSTLPRDAKTCVHNVNASAGWFLDAAQEICRPRREIRRVVAEVTARETASYDALTGSWPYMEGSDRPNDFNHNAGSIEAMLRLAPAIGRPAAARLMSRRDYAGPSDPIGQIRLLPYVPSRIPDFAQEAASQVERTKHNPMLLSQVAYWIARTARAEASRLG
jgi:hypothetical protein